MAEDKVDGKEIKICTSVFKSGENVITTKIYTQKWADVINTLEMQKTISVEKFHGI